jgi:hypothetical protein
LQPNQYRPPGLLYSTWPAGTEVSAASQVYDAVVAATATPPLDSVTVTLMGCPFRVVGSVSVSSGPK